MTNTGGAFVLRDWLLDDPAETIESLTERLSNPKLFATDYTPVFAKRMAITTVYTSNKLEQTLPDNAREHQMYKLLEGIFNTDLDEDLTSPAKATWPAEGIRAQTRETTAQMVQHLRALKYLMQHVHQSLTPDVIIKCHRILMAGSVNDDGTLVNNGKFRDHPSHAGTHVYAEGNPVILGKHPECICAQYRNDGGVDHF
ncbi:hypothetical protein M427DRAFT_364871 [Gonapodya prolifera JEL478]|uniref:Uncharacterized protein n=1 Tax=Gonapodya prolifera (strain JEL478) TaxID=1344416 RepID=A0A139AA41_GONPJ|nr:hypothetical protein M427DRAFT_364871 [Gonapodya prolifera JEL478]|eukprot:KXS13600.1 hypothetical protein M427DRAFT_364871 [Gonapodya prolifera JEL478]